MIIELVQILTRVYPNINENSINLFLCGKKTSEESIRKILISKYNEHMRVNIILPEWIFHNLLDNDKYDLLSLENILANDVDKIVLPIESYGTACELGVFSSNVETCEKLIVITKDIYKHDQSFIRYGPMKLVKKYKGHIIYYNEGNMDKLIKEVIDKTIYAKYEHKNDYNIFNISLLIGLFLLVVKPISKSTLHKIIYEMTNEEERIEAALEVLVQNGYLKVSKISKTDSVIDMTDKGLNHYSELVSSNGKERLVNKMRATNLWTKSKKQHTFRGDLEKTKLLVKTSS